MAELNRRERVDNDIDQLFDYMRRFDSDYEWQAEIAFGITQLAYEDAYRTGDDADAVAFTEQVAAPIVAYEHADASEPTVDLDYWEDRISDVPGTTRSWRVSPKSSRMSELYDAVADRFDPDAFDQVVGIFSAGVAPAYIVDEYFTDTDDPLIVRYSPRTRDDQEVTISPQMMDRADVAGDRLLVVDDGVERGGTAYGVCSALADRDPDEIQFVAAEVSAGPKGIDGYFWRDFQEAYEPRSWDAIRDYIHSDAYRETLEDYAASKRYTVTVPELHPLMDDSETLEADAIIEP